VSRTNPNPTAPNLQTRWREQADNLMRRAAGTKSRDIMTRLYAMAEQLRLCAGALEVELRWYVDEQLGDQARDAGKVRAIRCKLCGARWELDHPEAPPRCVDCEAAQERDRQTVTMLDAGRQTSDAERMGAK